MSIRISLYDFFAYMIPGVFYILVTAFSLTVLGFLNLDLNLLNELSLFTFIILLGAGYVLGNLIDHIAYKWLSLLKGDNHVARARAFNQFQKKHPWLKTQVNPRDWSILFQAIRIQKPDTLFDIEQHNATSIMLRNLSFGLFLSALVFFWIFITVYTHLGNLVLAITFLFLSSVALKRADGRRKWFYTRILEIFITIYLIQEGTLTTNLLEQYDKTEIVTHPDNAKLPQELETPK